MISFLNCCSELKMHWIHCNELIILNLYWIHCIGLFNWRQCIKLLHLIQFTELLHCTHFMELNVLDFDIWFIVLCYHIELTVLNSLHWAVHCLKHRMEFLSELAMNWFHWTTVLDPLHWTVAMNHKLNIQLNSLYWTGVLNSLLPWREYIGLLC